MEMSDSEVEFGMHNFWFFGNDQTTIFSKMAYAKIFMAYAIWANMKVEEIEFNLLRWKIQPILRYSIQTDFWLFKGQSAFLEEMNLNQVISLEENT